MCFNGVEFIINTWSEWHWVQTRETKPGGSFKWVCRAVSFQNILYDQVFTYIYYDSNIHYNSNKIKILFSLKNTVRTTGADNIEYRDSLENTIE